MIGVKAQSGRKLMKEGPSSAHGFALRAAAPRDETPDEKG
jgi:hypothetical protein